MGPREAVDAFDALCAADLVVTSKSGFSHLAATLCARPAVLAVPFWLDYACLPRALELAETAAVFDKNPSGAPVNLTARFDYDEAALLALLRPP